MVPVGYEFSLMSCEKDVPIQTFVEKFEVNSTNYGKAKNERIGKTKANAEDINVGLSS